MKHTSSYVAPRRFIPSDFNGRNFSLSLSFSCSRLGHPRSRKWEYAWQSTGRRATGSRSSGFVEGRGDCVIAICALGHATPGCCRPRAADVTTLAHSLTSSLFITSLNSRLIRCAAMFAMASELPRTVSTLSLSVGRTSSLVLRDAYHVARRRRRRRRRDVASRRVARRTSTTQIPSTCTQISPVVRVRTRWDSSPRAALTRAASSLTRWPCPETHAAAHVHTRLIVRLSAAGATSMGKSWLSPVLAPAPFEFCLGSRRFAPRPQRDAKSGLGDTRTRATIEISGLRPRHARGTNAIKVRY